MDSAKNVLFIVIDQLRADCVFGNLAQHLDLPNITALSANAVSFQRHYSVVNPCGPSRASLLTGQYSMNHRSVRNGTPMRHETPNIATEMRKAGYSPMLFGYTDTPPDPRVHHGDDPALRNHEYPMAGFQEVVEMQFQKSLPWRSHLINKGYTFDSHDDVYRPRKQADSAPKINDPAMYQAQDSDTAFLTDRFLATMPAYQNENWFAHLTYIRPHPPLVAPAPFNNMYAPDQIPLPHRHADPSDEIANHAFFEPTITNNPVADNVIGFPDLEPTDENIQALRSIYFGLITEVDHHIGRIITFLKDTGQYDNTLIVVTSDHGEMLGDRHVWGKLTVHDAAFHTPLIIRRPGNAGQAGKVVSQLVETIDIMPTILEWVGRQVPNSVDGRSLLPLLRGEAPSDWRTYSFSEFDFARPESPTIWETTLGTGPSDSSLAILREARFTLVEFAADLPPILYDHSAHGEARNVADDAEYQKYLNRLTRLMLKHHMKNMDHTLSLNTITDDGPHVRLRHPAV